MLQKVSEWLNLRGLFTPKIDEKNSGLPVGAKKYNFESWDDKFQVLQMKLMEYQRQNNKELIVDIMGKVPGLSIESSSEDSALFNNELHPMVEGRRWCHGHAITTHEGYVFIFQHRMDIKKPTQFYYPLVYTRGTVSPEEVEAIATAFMRHLEDYICEELNDHFRKGLEKIAYI